MTGNQGSVPEREPEKRLPLPRKAAGAQITHSRRAEVVTKNNDAGLSSSARNRNEIGAKHRSSYLSVRGFEYRLEGKSGASSRGNSSSNSVY